MDLLLAAANSGALLLCVVFIAYVAAILAPLLHRKPELTGDPSKYRWHVLIPCCDEEAVIADTVKRLHRQGGWDGIWIIDDASTDRTAAIVHNLARKVPNLWLISRNAPNARKGKGAALNTGYRVLRSMLPPTSDLDKTIVVVDADGWLDPGCRAVASGPNAFGDPTVGAAQAQVRMVDFLRAKGVDASSRATTPLQRLLVRQQDVEFSTVIAAMQLLRRRLRSVGLGGNGQLTRVSTLDRLADVNGTPWHGALLEDFELGLHVMLAGQRTAYLHDTWVGQEAVPQVGRLIRQRARWAQGSMQCIRYLWPVLRSPNIDTPAALEVSYFLLQPWVQLLGGVAYVICGIAMGVGLVGQGVGGGFNATTVAVLGSFVAFGIAPLAVWGPVYAKRVDPSLGRWRGVALGFAALPYLFVHHASVWTAAWRLVRSKNEWAKTARAADVGAAPTVEALSPPISVPLTSPETQPSLSTAA